MQEFFALFHRNAPSLLSERHPDHGRDSARPEVRGFSFARKTEAKVRCGVFKISISNLHGNGFNHLIIKQLWP